MHYLFVLTENFNQDITEQHFGLYRLKGSGCDNPSINKHQVHRTCHVQLDILHLHLWGEHQMHELKWMWLVTVWSIPSCCIRSLGFVNVKTYQILPIWDSIYEYINWLRFLKLKMLHWCAIGYYALTPRTNTSPLRGNVKTYQIYPN